jgi:hypothetical protein
MSENMKLWNILGRTDPNHVKQFKRAGGFAGHAIRPIWSFRRMTEEFGPCGIGWGVGEPSFQVVPGENREVMVYCTASIWYRQENTEARVYGVGGDKVVTHIKANEQYKRPERWESDDEAFKKAFTDAVTNALKLIGVGADVHMGLFDDNKYVNTMREEFSEPEKPKRQVGINQHTGAATAHSLKKDIDGPEGWNTFLRELEECQTTFQLNKLKLAWSAISDTWPKETAAGMPGWKQIAIEEIRKRQEIIINGLPDDDDVFPGDRPSREEMRHLSQHPLQAG